MVKSNCNKAHVLVSGSGPQYGGAAGQDRPVPRLPAEGGCPRFLPILAQRSTICGIDLCPARHPPQRLLQVTRNLEKVINEICNRTGRQRVPLSWPITENVLCCCMKIIDTIEWKPDPCSLLTAKKEKKVRGLSVSQFVHLLIYRFWF